jgi:hypothetical protein
MHRRARFYSTSFLTSLLLIGCGGGPAKPDASGLGGSGTGGSGGRGPLGGGGLTGTAGLSGTAGTTGAAGAAMPSGTPVFIGDGAGLIFRGAPCTWEEGATGDRWCAFVAASVSNPGKGDLFVVNVSKAAAGTAITCGVTDANCIRLTNNFGENAEHPAMFQGDSLVYYEFTGTPFGWRPGMAAGRMLAAADPTTLDVVLCTPSRKGTAVICLRDLPAAMQPDGTTLRSDLIAGKIDGAASPPLVKVETVISLNMADTAVEHFQMGFPVPGSDVIAWSGRATPTGPEILKTQTLGNDASRATVASAVSDWAGSPDGTRWYWRAQINETAGAATFRSGELQSAPYPGGASPVPIATNTLQYIFPTDTSLLTVDAAKQMLGFANPVTAPTTSQVIDTGVIGFVALSAQGFVSYAKTITTSASGGSFTDLFVKKSDGTGACTFTSATDGYPVDFIFTPSSGGAAWIQLGGASATAQFTRLSDCLKTSLGPNAIWTEPIGDRAVLFLDEYVMPLASIHFRTLGAGNAVSSDPASLMSRNTGSFAVTSSAGSDIVVYTVNGGANDDGVYIRTFGP